MVSSFGQEFVAVDIYIYISIYTGDYLWMRIGGWFLVKFVR